MVKIHILEHKKGHPKAENSTYWTAPFIIFVISTNIVFLIVERKEW
jgi:hypothetical protein